METVVLAMLLVLASVAAMAVGVMLGRPAIRGSCGGLSCGGTCAACVRDSDKGEAA